VSAVASDPHPIMIRIDRISALQVGG